METKPTWSEVHESVKRLLETIAKVENQLAGKSPEQNPLEQMFDPIFKKQTK